MADEQNQTQGQQLPYEGRESEQSCNPTPPIPPVTEPPNGKCKELPPAPDTPCLPPPKTCPQRCDCPPRPSSTSASTCFDELIRDQEWLLAEAERAKNFKTDLEDIQKKVVVAQQEYTVEKRESLVGKWRSADERIMKLVNKLVCNVPCWECLIECRLCPLLYSIQELEDRLNGTGTLTTEIYSLYDLRNWQERNVAARKEVLDRIKAVLAAWEKPAQALQKVLEENDADIKNIDMIMTSDPAKALYDLFTRLLPKHWAIRPRNVKSQIDKKYVDICSCYVSEPDDCCGPDVGRPTVLGQIIGPKPYLVEVDKLFEVLCCLTIERYSPAKRALTQAEVELQQTVNDISKAQKDIESKKNSLATDFKLSLEVPLDCENYTPKDGDGTRSPPPQIDRSAPQVRDERLAPEGVPGMSNA